MELGNGGIPILNGTPLSTKGQVGPPVAFIRDLDENGFFDPERVIKTPQGDVAIVGRHNIVTAEELVDMVVERLKPILQDLIHDTVIAIRNRGDLDWLYENNKADFPNGNPTRK